MENTKYINSLTIKSVRHLRNLPKIDLFINGQVKHLILTGKNGSGKSSVLLGIKNEFENVITGGKVTRKKNLLVDIGFEDFLDLGHLIAQYKADNYIIAYFPAQRKINPRKANLSKPVKITTQTLAEKNVLNENLYDFYFGLLLKQLSEKEKNNLQADWDIREWFLSFEILLKKIFENPNLEIKRDVDKRVIWLKQGDNEFNFNELSDGYSAILYIVVELLMQMGEKKNQIFDMEGIVLIDEVDVHLHLSLQKSILPLLTTFFPKMQFIVTTHSPFVLTSIDNAVIYDLEHNLLIKESIKGASYEAVIESYFKVDEYNDEVKEKIRRYRKLISNGAIHSDQLSEIFMLKAELEEKTKIPWLSKVLAGELAELEIMRRKKMVV